MYADADGDDKNVLAGLKPSNAKQLPTILTQKNASSLAGSDIKCGLDLFRKW